MSLPAPVMAKGGMIASEPSATWLFVIPWDLHHAGGVNQVIQNLFDEISRQAQFRPLLLVKSWEHPLPKESMLSGRRTIHLRLRGVNSGRGAIAGAIMWLIEFMRTLRVTSSLIQDNDVRVVNIHYPDSDVLTWLMMRLLLPRRRLRILVSFHGADLAMILRSGVVMRRVWRRLLSSVDGVTSCSAQLSQSLIHGLGVAHDKIHTLDNGINADAVREEAEGPTEAAYPADYLLSLATLEHKKGHDILIRAFDRIASMHPDLHLVIAGRTASDSDLQLILAEKSRAVAGDRIAIVRDLPHGEAMRALRRSRGLVLASRSEPFGIVVLEAAVLQKPVIATSCCGVLGRFESAAIQSVEAESVEQLARAIEELVRNRVKYDLDAAELGAVVARDFSWSRIARQFTAIALERVAGS
jgi:glycosyltransferase involved in cell wall biosynthesis